MPQPKVVSIGFSQRHLKIIFANVQHKVIVNSNNSRRSYDMEVVMKLTEQYDGHAFCHSGKMLKVGTKNNGLTYSVVLLTNPEWSVVIIKMNDYLHSCIARAQSWMGSQSIPTCSL